MKHHTKKQSHATLECTDIVLVETVFLPNLREDLEKIDRWARLCCHYRDDILINGKIVFLNMNSYRLGNVGKSKDLDYLFILIFLLFG